MEENTVSFQDNSLASPLFISEYTRRNLKEISQWTLFFSILGFLFIGFLVVAGFFLGAYLPKLAGQEDSLPLPGYLFGIIYAFMGAIYFPPVLFLYRFTRSIRKAFGENSGPELDKAFVNLKSHYRYIGILVAIFLVIYLMAGIIFGIIALFVKF